jgi:hypothetical protein
MNLNRRSQVIVAIQITGSAYAAITLLTTIPGSDVGRMTWFLYSILLTIPVFSFASGLLYWAGRTAGYYGSVAAHVLQLPMIFTTVLAYKLVFGIGVFLRIIDLAELVELTFGASTILLVAPQQQSTIVAINLYALFALMYLIRDRNKASEQSE